MYHHEIHYYYNYYVLKPNDQIISLNNKDGQLWKNKSAYQHLNHQHMMSSAAATG